jgi:hypothetical protein
MDNRKLKFDKIGETSKMDIGAMVKDPVITVDQFKQYACQLILQGVSSAAKKEAFCRDINKAATKELASYPLYNYLLAGEGKRSY